MISLHEKSVQTTEKCQGVRVWNERAVRRTCPDVRTAVLLLYIYSFFYFGARPAHRNCLFDFQTVVQTVDSVSGSFRRSINVSKTLSSCLACKTVKTI